MGADLPRPRFLIVCRSPSSGVKAGKSTLTPLIGDQKQAVDRGRGEVWGLVGPLALPACVGGVGEGRGVVGPLALPASVGEVRDGLARWSARAAGFLSGMLQPPSQAD
ncbi:hypothetical protein GCM10022380_61200 [Amycolatopsis tucumanensis]|uniref:Uncharacterized protein n=1 Tax=Amycolatopsis tucumanensis TaxID=401106 RepID=A0ABP7J602_9PSEU